MGVENTWKYTIIKVMKIIKSNKDESKFCWDECSYELITIWNTKEVTVKRGNVQMSSFKLNNKLYIALKKYDFISIFYKKS